MKRSKVLALILIVVLAALVVTGLSACAGECELTLAGQLYPGSTLLPVLSNAAGEDFFADETYVVEVKEGADFVTVSGAAVKISAEARIGDEFVLCVSGEGVKGTARFAVAAPPVTAVVLSCADKAEAGETLALDVSVSPALYAGVTPEFRVEGKGTIEDGALVIAEDADRGDVVVVTASYGGVTSEKSYVYVKTYQPKEIVIAGEDRISLPGTTISVSASVRPSYASYPLETEIVSGAAFATYDAERGELRFLETAPKGSEVTLEVRCHLLTETLIFRADNPPAKDVLIEGGSRNVAPGETRSFTYSLLPSDADIASVRIALGTPSAPVEWDGGCTFTVNGDAEQGEEITFLVIAGDVQRVVTYVVETRRATSALLSKDALDGAYIKSGEKVTFSCAVEPLDWAGDITYTVTAGADLVTERNGVFTVKADAGVGTVTVVAETSDGVRSNEVSFPVCGRYTRREYASWQNVSFDALSEKSSVWMVLPSALNAGNLTVLVPRSVTDLIIEGRYDGTEATAYTNLYFYFRNVAKRTITLKNFATIATSGLGGTVLDLGSSGTTTLVLVGRNAVYADSPYYLDNTGERVDGEWSSATDVRSIAWRSGKYGYNGSNGGTAISGYELVIKGDGSLMARAGDGTDGTPGGNGANASYIDGETIHLSGNGGNGGNGGDSGAAIHAYKVTFLSGSVTALAGNAGAGGAGGSCGSIASLSGLPVTAVLGEEGRAGKDGVVTPAVNAKFIEGSPSAATTGAVRSRTVKAGGSLNALVQKLAEFYGVKIYYGNKLDNPYGSDYPMTVQSDANEIMKQTQFLMYTFSVMPKNCWREFAFLSSKQVRIYFAKTIKSGSVLGLTSQDNKVWFATFETEMRGIVYSGYYNIMLHEFAHVCHNNLSSASAFESEMKTHNFGLSYGTSSDNTRVYGMAEEWDAESSCFLSSYSRKSVKEDVAETISMCSVYAEKPDFLAEGMPIRQKFDLIVKTFAGAYETMSRFKAPNLFAYDHLFESELG